MDLYGFSLTLGGAGLLLMGLRGVARGHGGDHGGHSGHGGHTGHAGHVSHAHLPGGSHAHGHAGGHGHGSHAGESRALALLSPRLMFSFLIGMGTAGLVIKPLIGSAGDLVVFALAV